MRLAAAIRGDLRKIMQEESNRLAVGVKEAAVAAGERTQAVLRGQVSTAGLPPSLAKAWRLRTYPKGPSLQAAAFVWSAAPRIHGAFDLGGVIRPRNGNWLAIPLPAAVALGLGKSRRHSRGSRPRNWADVEAAIRRFGALRPVPLAGGRILLVAEQVTAGGRRSRTRRTREGAEFSAIGRGKVSMPLFLLVRSVTLAKRLSVERAAREGEAWLYAEVARRI